MFCLILKDGSLKRIKSLHWNLNSVIQYKFFKVDLINWGIAIRSNICLVIIMTDPRKGRQETIRALISREGVLVMLIMGQLGDYFFTLCGFKMTSFQGGKNTLGHVFM